VARDFNHATINGYRSGFEAKVAEQLVKLGLPANYEPFVIQYDQPLTRRKYTPDFQLPNGIIIETKGRFLSDDRKKHLLVQAQYPSMDLRFLFQNPNARISKASSTTYAAWCEKHGFKYAKGPLIPKEWLT
jgi:hypothetical protein